MAELGKDIGRFGFGLMRLPQKDGKTDVEQVKEMVDMFMEAGFTYFDTARAYGDSEDAIRQALVERYPRESFQLASKNAAWIGCKTREEAEALLDETLEHTGAGYLDYYLLHNIGGPRTHVFEDFGLWDFVKDMKAQGKIRHIGFSLHSTADELDAVLSAHPEAEFVQLQINYADWEDPVIQSRKCLEVARRHGKPVIVMEPVKGGMLATPPESVKGIFEEAEPGSSPASWAVRFTADLEGVAVVLSGMSSVEQMRDNLSFMKGFDRLTDSQRDVLARASKALSEVDIIPCTSCNYCTKVCPENIGIPETFTAMNKLTLYGNKAMAAGGMVWDIDGQGKLRADKCIQCGSCEDACPQSLKIVELLEKAVETFGPSA